VALTVTQSRLWMSVDTSGTSCVGASRRTQNDQTDPPQNIGCKP